MIGWACDSNQSNGWSVHHNLHHLDASSPDLTPHGAQSQYFMLLTGVSDSEFYENTIIDPWHSRWGGTGQAFYITDNACGCSENRNNTFTDNLFVNVVDHLPTDPSTGVEFSRVWDTSGRASGNVFDGNTLQVIGCADVIVDDGSSVFSNTTFLDEAGNICP
jgi:hypothetical protein